MAALIDSVRGIRLWKDEWARDWLATMPPENDSWILY